MQEGLYPNLVVEKRNNDFAYINIADLDILKDMTYTNLATLDNYLQHFTEQEIKDSIERANVVPDTEISDKKLLIKYGNYKLPLLSKEIREELDMFAYIAENFEDKSMKNIFFNKISSIVKDEKRKVFYKDVIDHDSKESFIESLKYLTYNELRELYFYLYNYVAKNKDLRDNKRKREKVND